MPWSITTRKALGIVSIQVHGSPQLFAVSRGLDKSACREDPEVEIGFGCGRLEPVDEAGGAEEIIGIEEEEELTRCRSGSEIPTARGPLFPVHPIEDSDSFFREGVQGGPFFGCRLIIDQNDFPVLMSLFFNGIDRLLNQSRTVEMRNDNGHESLMPLLFRIH